MDTTDIERLRERLTSPEWPRSNGWSPAETAEAHNCPDCRDEGFVVVDGVAQECRCRLERAKELTRRWQEGLAREAQIPRHFRGKTLAALALEHPDTRKLVDACQAYMDDDKVPWLVMLGVMGDGKPAMGNGKTHCAAAIAQHFLSQANEEGGCPVFFCDVPSFSVELLAAQFDKGRHYQMLQRAMAVELLVLDDFGAQYVSESDWTGNQLYTVLNRRYLDMKRTVITSNLTLSMLPPRLASRLRDGEVCKIVNTKAPDYRSKKGGRQ